MYCKCGDPERGLSFEAADRYLQPEGISREEVRKAVRVLCEDGMLYSSIDENYFLPTSF